MARRRLADGLRGWCDPDRGEIFLAEGMTAEEEADVLRKITAKLLGDHVPQAVALCREMAVRPQLYALPGGREADDIDHAV